MKKTSSSLDYKYVDNGNAKSALNLEVTGVGFQKISSGDVYPPKCHPDKYYFNAKEGRKLFEYQLIYITDGKGCLVLNDKKYSLNKGNFFIIRPGQWHTYTPDTYTGWHEYYIGFNGSFIDSWIKGLFADNSNIVYNIGLNEELVQLFSRAIEIAKFSSSVFNLHLSGIVYHLLGLISYEMNNNELALKRDLELVEKSKIIMNENIGNHLCIENLSTQLSTNYTTFRKNFKMITGFSPKQYFLELKMRKSKKLLVETSFSVKEISLMIGFTTVEQFVNSFKKRNNVTPTEYRRVCRLC